MSKVEQILTIEPPHELKFKGPFTTQRQAAIVLKNPSDKKVAFKIKTTAPKSYYVWPNCGELAPKKKAEILILLQPFDYDANKKIKNKFLVQTVVIDPATDYAEDGKTIQWTDIVDGRKMDSLLKCSFEMPSIEQLDSKNIHDKTEAVKETSVETELKKPGTEVKELGKEENLIGQENIKLKEELLQLQQESKEQLSQKLSICGSQNLDMKNKNANITLMIGLAIVVALLSFIFGKYVF